MAITQLLSFLCAKCFNSVEFVFPLYPPHSSENIIGSRPQSLAHECWVPHNVEFVPHLKLLNEVLEPFQLLASVHLGQELFWSSIFVSVAVHIGLDSLSNLTHTCELLWSLIVVLTRHNSPVLSYSRAQSPPLNVQLYNRPLFVGIVSCPIWTSTRFTGNIVVRPNWSNTHVVDVVVMYCNRSPSFLLTSSSLAQFGQYPLC